MGIRRLLVDIVKSNDNVLMIANKFRKNDFLLKVYSLFNISEQKEIIKYLDKIPQDYECQKVNMKKMARDLRYCKKKYEMDTNEYFRYRFYMLSEYGRRQYICDYESDCYLKKISDKETWILTKDKYLSYVKLKDNYKREVIKIEGKKDYDIFCEFCKKHPNFIVKPIGMYAGIGVHKLKIDETDVNNSYINVFNNLLGNGITVVEELIEQDEGLALFHPQSINTIRVVTFHIEDRVEILQTSIRMGLGDSDIDSGAISASIDIETGIISSCGRGSKNQQLYLLHPDTGVIIPGYKIPDWENLITLAKSLSLRFPKQIVLGWDFSYSKKGWVVVEVNTQPAIQVLSGHGIGARPIFEKIARKIKN